MYEECSEIDRNEYFQLFKNVNVELVRILQSKLDQGKDLVESHLDYFQTRGLQFCHITYWFSSI